MSKKIILQLCADAGSDMEFRSHKTLLNSLNYTTHETSNTYKYGK